MEQTSNTSGTIGISIEQKKIMILFAHRHHSSLISSLPIELVYFIFTFSKSLTKESKYVCSHIMHPIRFPFGLKVHHSKQLFVCSEHYVKVFDKDHSFLYQFGGEGTENGKFKHISAIDISTKTQKVYVSDISKQSIQIFDIQGNFLSTFGAKGSTQGLFCSAFLNFSLSASDQLFVVDSANYRVQVLTESGEYLYSFEPHVPKTEYIHGIAVSRCSDKVFVADSGNNRIQVFSQKGQFLFSFGKQGREKGLFDDPLGLCVDEENHVFVADSGNNRIQIFDGNGNFLLCFGSKDDVSFPCNLGVDKEGNVFVCDFPNSAVNLWEYQ